MTQDKNYEDNYLFIVQQQFGGGLWIVFDRKTRYITDKDAAEWNRYRRRYHNVRSNGPDYSDVQCDEHRVDIRPLVWLDLLEEG